MATQKVQFQKKLSDKEIDEEISKLADILFEGFMWEYEHKDELEEQHIPRLWKKRKGIGDLDPGQTLYL